ncbi:MAG: 30S ribosomal protein S8 [Magnetococcales bacterium]|nr:30S ribosomal protein S8 [Magnetococcales bacterium]
MPVSDPISDMLTRIRNAQMVRKETVEMPSSQMKERVARILLEEGYISSIDVQDPGTPKKALRLGLKYYKGKPVIEEIKGFSSPGRRFYVGKDEIPQVKQGLGIAILSTNQGVISSRKARQVGVGGELLCTVF